MPSAKRRLLLLGGGHAHVHVLQSLHRTPLAGAEVTLVTPFRRQMYSGMVPGLVAGHYEADACAIPLPPLAAAARVSLIDGAAAQIDADQRRVRLEDGRWLDCDVLSIDTGAVMRRDRLPGAAEHALFVRPIEHFVRHLDGLWSRATEAGDPGAAPRSALVVVGGGAAGVELALALRHRLTRRSSGSPMPTASGVAPAITLLTGGPPPLADYPPRARKLVARALSQRGVQVLQQRCCAVEADALVLDDGARLRCDAAILATGSEAPRWLQGSGLALDDRGFIRTGATLQSVSHPAVFAVGDVAERDDEAHPRSGVYAVRAGPPLAANLRHAIAGAALQPHHPPQRTLNLISTGDRNAILTYGRWSLQGRWAWWWKDRIDRGFVRTYRVGDGDGGGELGPADRSTRSA
ncbi:MAG: FAD-dependent oxidoreductase [Rubrivivax sp.]